MKLSLPISSSAVPQLHLLLTDMQKEKMLCDVTTVGQRIKLNGKRCDKKEKSDLVDEEKRRSETHFSERVPH